jgi:hypothetical protein
MTILRGLPTGPERPFVCPWCGSRFERRHIASDGVWSLEEHWRRTPECSANRAVNNPTQSKYDIQDAEIPGLVLPDREDRDA